ncbi:hypothetical protein AB3N59_10070 [Leptospira sp. WS92.C1]
MISNGRVWIRFLNLFVLPFLFGIGCVATFPSRYYDHDCGSAYSSPCPGYRNDFSPYGFQNRSGYYRNHSSYPYYYNGGNGGGHNPMSIPSGRFNNFSRPSKWRL